jgi:nucleotide-binding universal stress UspA family protein
MRPANGAVMVGVDGSPGSMPALEFAAGEAALREVPLRIIYVLEPVAGRHRVSPRQALARAYQAAEHHHPALEITTDALPGSPAAVLIGESARACLTVVGHRGSGGYLGLVAGAVCTEVATAGHGPVLVTRGTTALHAGGPVVVGVDIDDPATPAIDFAFTEAGLRDVALRAVYAATPARVSRLFEPDRYDPGEIQQQAARLLAEALAGWAERHPDVKLDMLVQQGPDAPAAMLQASSSAGLIVVGPPDTVAGRRPRDGVTTTLIHHAGCPVAVVHPSVQ